MSKFNFNIGKIINGLQLYLDENYSGENLTDYFTYSILAQYDHNTVTYTCTVKHFKREFQVSIEIFEYFSDGSYQVDTYCSCEKGYDCVHTFTFAKNLIRYLSNDKTTGRLELKEIDNFVNFVENKETLSFLETLSPTHNKPFTPMLEKDNIISFHFKDLVYNYYYHDEYKVSFKLKEEKLTVRCFSCKKNSASNHCEHVKMLLQLKKANQFLINFYTRIINYESIFSQIKTDIGIDSEDYRDFIEIYLHDQGYSYRNTNPNYILTDSDLVTIKGVNHSTKSDEDLKQEFEAIHSLKYAFLWTKNGSFHLLSGRMSKKGDNIVGLSLESSLIDVPSSVTAIFSNINSFVEAKSWSLLYKFIFENVNELNSYYNFYYNQDTNQYFSNFSRSDLHDFKFVSETANLSLKVKNESNFSNLNFSLKLGEESISFNDNYFSNPYLVLVDKKAYPFKNNNNISLHLIKDLKVANVPKLIQSVISKYSEFAYIEYLDADEMIEHTNIKKQIHLREVGNFILFEPSIIYDDKFKKSIFEIAQIYDLEQNSIIQLDEEQFLNFREWMSAMHPRWKFHNSAQHYYFLSPKELVENFWFLHFFEKAKEQNIEIFGQEKLSKLKYNTNTAKVKTSISSGIDWFKPEVEIKFGSQTVDQKDWYESIKNNEKFVKLADGTVGILPEEWFNKLKKLVLVSEKDGNKLKINKLKFFIIDELFHDIDDAKIRKELDDKKQALANYSNNKKYKLPKNLNAELRPYQKAGFQWLKFCNEYGFGGCLADDMGLGKTIQVIALLLDQKNSKQKTSIVIVPKSLLFNWAAEIEKFAPSLKFHLHHGNIRSKNFSIFSEFDVVISTYDTITRDIETLKDFVFNYAILDESQAIKNISSQRYKATRVIQSLHKLVMTGTPVENNTFDLYAQFSFLNPGLLGSVKHFTDNFSTPIDTLGSREAASTLKNMIHPFLLRRTKENVAKDLPSKTESIIFCDMGDEQRKQYESLRLKIKEDIENTIESDGLNNSKFKILEGLLRLRQMCNSPELIDSTLPEKMKESVKIQTIVEQLSDELGNHKALVFSQFVSMLDLIKKQLDHKKIKYAYLDGSTNDRSAAVNDFMENDDCNVFLLSLKAGNAGLNLTKADYVYIVDPWWNPSVEAQAVDRTHRIGQTKNIFAYRLICRDTIEEKIVELQSKKKKLSADLIQADENIFKSLDKGELMSLFN